MRQKWCLASEDVQRMAAACKQEAARDDVEATIAIVDEGGAAFEPKG